MADKHYFEMKSGAGRFSKISVLIIFVISILATWSYIQAEIITSVAGIDGVNLCREVRDLKYYKVISINGNIGQAELVCVSSNPDLSMYYKINQIRDTNGQNLNWQIMFSSRIYNESHLIWPVYL
jgi:hypothetical protein